MTALALAVALGVLLGAIAGLVHADRVERRTHKARWRNRRLAAHTGPCPWSGRTGHTWSSTPRLLQCPRCQELFLCTDGDPLLPDHRDDRTL